MYFITNPVDKTQHSIYSSEGSNLLNNYIQYLKLSGGSKSINTVSRTKSRPIIRTKSRPISRTKIRTNSRTRSAKLKVSKFLQNTFRTLRKKRRKAAATKIQKILRGRNTRRNKLYNKCISKDNSFLFHKSTKIKISKSELLLTDKYNEPVSVPKYIAVFKGKEKIKLNKVKYLSSGTYGKIILYSNLDIEIVLKIEINDSPSEKEIGEILVKNPQCNTIRVRHILSNKDTHYYIMDPLDGEVSQLTPYFMIEEPTNDTDMKEASYQWFIIIEEIRKQIVCLFKLGYYYTDLKLANILFCNDNGHYTIHLGDLGSATPDKEYNENLATFPPVEFADSNGWFPVIQENKRSETKTAKQILTWLLGINALNVCFNNKFYDKLQTFYDEIYNDEELRQIMIDNNAYINGTYAFTFKFMYIIDLLEYEDELETFTIQVIEESYLDTKHKDILKRLLKFNPEHRIDENKGGIDILKPLPL